MYIENLKLKNYRNFKNLNIKFDKNINIIYGNNAEGKTNILESIYFSATLKSHKNSKDSEIINFDEKETFINLNLYKKNKERIIDINLKKNKSKAVAIDKIKIDKLSDYIGFVNVIFFAPEDLNIIREGPKIRRKYIDFVIFQIDKIYIHNVNNYNKVLENRNSLLKEINFTKDLEKKKELLNTLDTWDIELVKYGSEIIKKRKENIEYIKDIIKEKHKIISNDEEEVEVFYECDVEEENFLDKLKSEREKDIKYLYTSVGPHKDDLKFIIKKNVDDNVGVSSINNVGVSLRARSVDLMNNVELKSRARSEEIDIRKFGSQGQKKTLAISLKLAEIEVIKKNKFITPILLLDDVFSELDEKRQKLLIDNIKDVQTIITCTGIKRNLYQNLKPDKIFHLHKGVIEEKNLL